MKCILDVLPIVGGIYYQTFEGAILVTLGYHLLVLAMIHLVSDNRIFEATLSCVRRQSINFANEPS